MPTVTCQNPACGRQFTAKQSRIDSGNGRYCSRDCFLAASARTFVDLVCEHCGQPFQVVRSDYDRRVAKGHTPRWCSHPCSLLSESRRAQHGETLRNSKQAQEAAQEALQRAQAWARSPEGRLALQQRRQGQLNDPAFLERYREGIRNRSDIPSWRDAPHHQRGEAHPQWRGNKTERERAWRTGEYQGWRAAVFERDGYRCRCCGHRRHIEAHHVKSWARHPDLRYVVENGLTLCEVCHDWLHSGPGNDQED